MSWFCSLTTRTQTCPHTTNAQKLNKHQLIDKQRHAKPASEQHIIKNEGAEGPLTHKLNKCTEIEVSIDAFSEGP